MTVDNGEDPFPEPKLFVFLPDRPDERRDATVFDHLGKTGNAYYLGQHLGKRKTVLIGSSLYISPVVTDDPAGLFDPDLFVSYNADKESYSRRNGYVISEQGKPPDFVLEIASCHTGDLDDTVKREAYAALGITEYWRFDPTGEYNRVLLAADRLVNGRYQPVTIVQLGDEIWQGRSQILNLDIRWERSQLQWHDPATARRLPTFEDMRERANAAKTRADASEARVRELEEKIQRFRDQ